MLAADYCVDGYFQVLEQAAARGVTVLLETHDDWSSTAAVRAVVARGAHPSLRVLWDVMHPQRQLETVAESYVPHIAALGLPLRHPSEISALAGTQLL